MILGYSNFIINLVNILKYKMWYWYPTKRQETLKFPKNIQKFLFYQHWQ
jgi:hypothetical protein